MINEEECVQGGCLVCNELKELKPWKGVWDDDQWVGACPTCLADAKLGRMVRDNEVQNCYLCKHWHHCPDRGEPCLSFALDAPEEALENAGVKG